MASAEDHIPLTLEKLFHGALAAQRRGDAATALANYDRILLQRPDHSETLFFRGHALAALGRSKEALDNFQRAAQQLKEPAAAFYNAGNLLLAFERFEEALAAYDRAVAGEPGDAEFHNNRGNALRALRRFDEALLAYERAIALHPRYAEAFNNRGIVLGQSGRLADALASYDQAIALRPDIAEPFYNRGIILTEIKRLPEALASYDRAVALQPNHAEAAGAAFDVAARLCDWATRAQRCNDLISRVQKDQRATPFAVLNASDDPALHARAAANTAPAERRPAPRNANGHQRLRIAYVSADLRDHVVARTAIEFFERHDRDRFELWAISLRPAHDSPMRRRIEAAFEHVVDASQLSDKAVAELMRAREIDIAVDLMGYTQDNRIGIFAERAAPIQVTYLGYPGTTGASFIDYILADRTVIPDAARQYFSENVVYLPDSYMPFDSTRKIAKPAPARSDVGLPMTGFVFCCFNASYKIAPPIFDVWMQLLSAIDDSVLWLPEGNAVARDHLREEARSRGVAPNRLVFAPSVEADAAHLARLQSADLFLDTLPYNAHATASDALWAGLPVLTCAGKSFPARVAASLLAATGVPELITTSLEEYERLALTLARDHDRLAALRAKLLHNRATCPLFDTTRYCRHMEGAYLIMVERHRRGDKPATFAIVS